MAKIQQMLAVSGGSFRMAEQFALDVIAKGETLVWLDLALLLHAQGKIESARQAMQEYEKYYPECPRLRWGKTWFSLYDGNLPVGLEHIEAGRVIGCLGAQDFSKFEYPKWNGRSDLAGASVVLYGEGGHGDQIMGLRSARWLRELGATVTVACSKPLMNLFSLQGECGVIDREHAHAFKADYWVPMMSSFGLCGRTWETLWTGPYLKAPESDIWERIIEKRENLNVGIRWRGNPEFEHEQLRWFPPELMFKLTEITGVDYWSLQKEDPQADLPKHIQNLEPLLGNWEQTAAAISQLDLVITSCTSIAHLSAAMGKPTWVVVPVMPYYPWARPGRFSKWYPTVTLFRQRCYGEWVDPFREAYECLQRRVEPTNMQETGFVEFCAEYDPPKCSNGYFMEGNELSVITGLARKHDVQSVLEIGINKGETAKALLDACPSITRYTGIEITEDAVDSMHPHQQNERVRVGKDVAGAVRNDKRVETFMSKNGSRDFKPAEPYDLVFIDGNHLFDWVKHDTKLAHKLNAKVVVWHDYGTEPGVTRAVNEVGRGVVRVLGTRIAYQLKRGRAS